MSVNEQESTLVTTREAPWYKLGKLVDQPMTAQEAASLGGLNFTVSKRPLWFGNTSDIATAEPNDRIHDRVAVVRDDTSEWLGIMSKNYPVLQYGDAFDFIDTINTTYVACGALKGGRQGFMVVKFNESLNVLNGDDYHELFLVLRTSHDGSRAVEVAVMPLRHKCMNQLTLHSFTQGVPHRWAIKHTSTMAAKLIAANKSLTNLAIYAKAFESNVRRLVNVKLTNDDANEVLRAVLPERPKKNDQITRIMSMWHTSETVGFDWTGWGLVNAVSEYFDWVRVGGNPESRFVAALQGQTTNAINRVTGRILSRFA